MGRPVITSPKYSELLAKFSFLDSVAMAFWLLIITSHSLTFSLHFPPTPYYSFLPLVLGN